MLNIILNVLSFTAICASFFFLGQAYEISKETRKILDSMESN